MQRLASKDTKEKPSFSPSNKALVALSGLNIINTWVERFGWPGTIILLIFWFVVRYASREQKAAIINEYVLGRGSWHAAIVASVLFVLVLAAQWQIYKKQLSALMERNAAIETELNRLRSEKEADMLTTPSPAAKKSAGAGER